MRKSCYPLSHKLAQSNFNMRAAALLSAAYMPVLLTVNGWADDSNLFDLMDGGIPGVVQRLVIWFDTSVTPILLLCAFIILAIGGFTGNEKAVQAAKLGFKAIFVAFAGCNCLYLIINTVTWLINTVTGQS